MLTAHTANPPFESVDELVSAIFEDDTANLTLEINLDGANSHSLKLMPNLDRNALKDFFAQVLNSSVVMMLPHLLTVIVQRLRLVPLISHSSTLGDELISVLNDVGLWDSSVNLGSTSSQSSASTSLPSGAIDLSEFNRLVADPNSWLLGSEEDVNNSPIQGKLPELLSSGFKTMSRFILPESSDNMTIITTSGLQGKPLTRILWHPDPDPNAHPYSTFYILEIEFETGSSYV